MISGKPKPYGNVYRSSLGILDGKIRTARTDSSGYWSPMHPRTCSGKPDVDAVDIPENGHLNWIDRVVIVPAVGCQGG